jgi:hypothetical protein
MVKAYVSYEGVYEISMLQEAGEAVGPHVKLLWAECERLESSI